jgi:tRNA threonylcarbamoyladenosine biosynthesis protein TsaB
LKLLGIETSGRGGSVALSIDGRVDCREFSTPREQTERLLAVIDELLRAAGLEVAGLDGIAFGRGPGSFTGLRVAAAVAQGLAAPTRVPLLPVSSLLCLAQGAWRLERVEHSVACVDAHMGEIYWGEFEVRGGALRAAGPERLGAPSELAPPAGSDWVAVGGGFAAQREALAAVLAKAQRALPELEPAAEDLFPAAAEALAAGHAASPREALPVYLREHTAWRRSN